MHPDPDTLAPRPIANASTHPVTRTVTAITNGKRCPICDQTTRSKQDLLKHIRSTHMMGQLAEIQTMREAGIPVCQRCGVFVVGGLTKTHEDECKYHYDGSAHKALLDKLTVATLQWAKLPLQALEHQLTALTWPRTTSSAPAHVHLPRASQFKVAIATVLSKVAQLCENPPYINAGHKLLLWLPRLILTASPTAKLPSDMDELAASRLLMLLDGHYDELLAIYDDLCAAWLNQPRDDHQQNILVRAERLTRHGLLSDAANTLMEHTPVADTRNPFILATLRGKFKCDTCPPPPPHLPLLDSHNPGSRAPLSYVNVEDILSIVKNKK